METHVIKKGSTDYDRVTRYDHSLNKSHRTSNGFGTSVHMDGAAALARGDVLGVNRSNGQDRLARGESIGHSRNDRQNQLAMGKALQPTKYTETQTRIWQKRFT